MQTTHRLIVGDAGAMGALGDESIDLVVTSPPYPMIAMWDEQFARVNPAVGRFLEDGRAGAAFEAMHQILDRTWAELKRVLKEGAFACINIGDAARNIGGSFKLYANHARIEMKFFGLGFDIMPLILWRKQTNAPNKFMGSGMLPAGAYVTLEHEYILIFRKGGKRLFETRHEREKRLQSSFFWEERNSWFSDHWDLKGTRQQSLKPHTRDRSAAFPFLLPFRLINMFSLLSDTVLDPFAGTGTTILAAMAAGRNSTGFEVDSGYSALLRQRIFEELHALNNFNLDRINAHLAFVRKREKDGGSFQYENSYFRFPVMSRQEEKMKLPFIKAAEERGEDSYRVSYFEDQYVQGLEPQKLSMFFSGFDQSGIQDSIDFGCGDDHD